MSSANQESSRDQRNINDWPMVARDPHFFDSDKDHWHAFDIYVSADLQQHAAQVVAGFVVKIGGIGK